MAHANKIDTTATRCGLGCLKKIAAKLGFKAEHILTDRSWIIVWFYVVGKRLEAFKSGQNA